jgi:hypothetical protein
MPGKQKPVKKRSKNRNCSKHRSSVAKKRRNSELRRSGKERDARRRSG